MTLRRFLRATLCGAILLSITPVLVHGQQTRDDRIRQAFGEFDSERSLELLYGALNPAAGPSDETWASGVQLLAQILLESSRDSLAATWLRWAARITPDMQIDTLQFIPEVLTAFRTAVGVVNRQRTSTAPPTQTRWQWREATTSSAPGGLRVDLPGVSGARLNIVSVGVLDPGTDIQLLPGSYTVQTLASGYAETSTTREVLPGVTTLLTVELEAVLTSAIESAGFGQLARITSRTGTNACKVGVVAGRDGLVLTTRDAIGNADDIEVRLANGVVYRNRVIVAAQSDEQGLAVIKLPTEWNDSLQIRPTVVNGQPAWRLWYRDCQSPMSTEARIDSWQNRPRGLLVVRNPLANAEAGGVLIDQSGAVVGMVAGSNTAFPAQRAIALLEEARLNVLAGNLVAVDEEPEPEIAVPVDPPPATQVAPAGSGGFPWPFAAVGAGAAGVVIAVVLTSGSSGGGNGTPPPGSGVGGIIITFPNQ